MSWENELEELRRREAMAEQMGGPEKLARQHGRGKMDARARLAELVDDGSFFEVKPLFAPEMVTGFGRLEGHPVGVVANNPAVKGGVLFTDTADKATRFVTLCNAFNLPLIFLADVPGFMIGTQVEREGIIRHGAKMISAISEATVPKICVVLRKCYGAGLYAMCGPAFEPDATVALPTAQIAVMGPEPAVNAVFYNPGDHASLAAHLARVVGDDAARATMGERSRQILGALPGYERMVREYGRIFAEAWHTGDAVAGAGR